MKVLRLKRIRALLVKVSFRLKEKRHNRVRYLLQTKGKQSDTLIVCFSGFGGEGAAKYNYVRTLQKVNADKLFILDDFGYQKQGSYYLGENGDWFLPEMITDLIQTVQKKRHVKHLVMVGSSKGGSASLYYGIKLGADACVIGAPQYFIGEYLNTEKHLPILEGIMGNTTSESIQKLNRLMSDCISATAAPKPKVYIHYSPKEHTYHEHIFDMIGKLESCGYTVSKDAEYDYTDHGEVAKYFPMYLLSVLKKMIEP